MTVASVKAARCEVSHPSATEASSSRKSTTSPRAVRTPVFRAPDSPWGPSFGTTVQGGARTLTNVFGDNASRGPVSFNTDVGLDTNTDSRLSMWGNIAGPGGVTKVGRGKVVLLSSHELETVERVCSQVVIIHRGKIVANDAIERLRALTTLSTLEDIFSQLAVEQDVGGTSRRIADLIQA